MTSWLLQYRTKEIKYLKFETHLAVLKGRNEKQKDKKKKKNGIIFG